MKWWPIFGFRKRLTENNTYRTEVPVEAREKIFRKSLHIYPIDVGNANDLNFDLKALQTPQYNIHRFGIFFADVPRHADVLLILGKPTEKMLPVLMETINQMPEPFSIVAVENDSAVGKDIASLHLPSIAAHITDYKRPEDLLAVLLKIMGKAN